ncbi:MAG: prepilin-type N-terminal cleavage/methylation domain-containing protein [Gammaproteobacteria bacterium]|nr:prepilin-type N-terminal cleavage/methylation domain-containing protein [Gammaproteobacteria bacterium]
MTIETRNGFTLIEVMVAVTVMAILSAIAYPIYESQSRKGKRGDGIASLEKVALAEQPYFSHMNTFTETVTNLNGIESATSPGGYYTITVAPGATGSIASSFVVTAQPLTDGQKKDTCQSFTLSNLGVRGATAVDSSGKAMTDVDARLACWGK